MTSSVHARAARWQSMTAAAAMALAAALGGAPLPASADPSDEYAQAMAEDDDYRAGKAAIDAMRWEDATSRLSRAAVRYPDNADLHNYLGFAFRKLGRMDRAFEHYERALAIDPRHRGAHEYIGEAYLQVGDLAGAEKHLVALQNICLLACEELADLEKAVKRHRQSTATGTPPGKAQ